MQQDRPCAPRVFPGLRPDLALRPGPAAPESLEKAAEQGYDPNVWFDNVELLAAQEIGRETVQYVANIYRYYLTYRMVAMQALAREEARKAAGIGAAVGAEGQQFTAAGTAVGATAR